MVIDLEKRLQIDYVGKYWLLQGFYEGQDLLFGADGTLLRGERAESWTLGGVEVTALKVRAGYMPYRLNAEP